MSTINKTTLFSGGEVVAEFGDNEVLVAIRATTDDAIFLLEFGQLVSDFADHSDEEREPWES